jgi:hypothetical protein
MSDNKDDLTIAYMSGYHDAKSKYADEIERLREALREITSADIQCWAMVALTNPDPKAWRDMLEQIAQYDMQKIAIDALIERKE